jgi:hypothetical protein
MTKEEWGNNTSAAAHIHSKNLTYILRQTQVHTGSTMASQGLHG